MLCKNIVRQGAVSQYLNSVLLDDLEGGCNVQGVIIPQVEQTSLSPGQKGFMDLPQFIEGLGSVKSKYGLCMNKLHRKVLQVVKYAEENGKRTAGRKYDVDPKKVRRWVDQKTSLEKTKRCIPTTDTESMGGSLGDISEDHVTQEKRKKGWRMSCDVGEAIEGLENDL